MAKKLASIVLPGILSLPGCSIFNQNYVPENLAHEQNNEKVYYSFKHPDFSLFIVDNKGTRKLNDRRVDVYEKGGTKKSLIMDREEWFVYRSKKGDELLKFGNNFNFEKDKTKKPKSNESSLNPVIFGNSR